ncbi:SEC-C domain-containing protein [candidate division KSB1 bacterium]|nr:SEC-C domain-containing protein [candidate division KSB1 bacterium]
MKTTGRNDPCPCGSQKKYKNCCLNKQQQSNSSEMIWAKLRAINDQLVNKLIQHGYHFYGPGMIEDAWEEFSLGSGKPFDENASENQLFVPWLLYSWWFEVDIEDGDNAFDDFEYRSIAQDYLEVKYNQLSEMQRDFIKLVIDRPYSFYEIIDCSPGTGFRMKDLLTGEEIDVLEKSGSQNAAAGNVLFGQIIQYETVGMVIGSSSILITPGFIPSIIHLRKQIREGSGAVGEDELIEWEAEIRSLYLSIYESMHRSPKLVNTDGDPMVLLEIHYHIDSPETVFDKLKSLATGVPEQDLLSEARFDENGKLLEIEFPWLRLGNAVNKEWQNTVLARITIEKNHLKINVNSEERAKKIKTKIKTLLKGQAVYKKTEIQSMDSIMEQAKKGSGKEDDLNEPEEPFAPELRELLDKHLREHWKGWIHQKIPALGDITPLAAAKDPEGREMLKALLDDFERSDCNSPPDQSQKKYIDWARKELGLA